MNKKSYLRTIEVMIAILVTFLFVYFVFPKSQTPQENEQITVLKVLENNPDFRNCILGVEYGCVENYLKDYVPPNYDFVFDISEDVDVFRPNLPEKNINTETIYISGNTTEYSPKLLKLYYWRKE
ncbi:hypothetical protein KY308_03490 [Candidatus Woesearchaeota archaeon]|nr:hypothetical protein [Candidatus Woesearchaeota archaeon]